MKKLTIALVALLICASVFAATTTVTAGLGFGGYIIPHDFSKENPNERYLYNMGPAFFVGADYVNEQGLTIYDDIAFNLGYKDNGKLLLANPKVIYITATEYAGVGYTFKKDLFTIMAGAGIEAKASVYGLDKIFETEEGVAPSFVSIGLGARIKGSYTINEMFDVSVQLNPSYNFKNLCNVETAKELLVTNKLPLASGNLLVGATYKF